MLRSRSTKGKEIEEQHHRFLAPELAEIDLLARRAGKCEVRCFISDFQRHDIADVRKEQGHAY